MTQVALSLLALPRVEETDRVDPDFDQSRECSGLSLDLKPGIVLARVRCGLTTAPQEGGKEPEG